MSLISLIMVASLFFVGIYMLFENSIISYLIGLALCSHAANIIWLSAGTQQDPFPRVFILTAIVIALGITAYILIKSKGIKEYFHDDL